MKEHETYTFFQNVVVQFYQLIHELLIVVVVEQSTWSDGVLKFDFEVQINVHVQ